MESVPNMPRLKLGGIRGSSLVELPLVLLPLLAVLFATVDFSLTVFLRSTFRHAVREGVRYAVTSRTSNGLGHDASIRAVVQKNAMGFLNGDNGASKIYIRYYKPGTLTETQSNAAGNIVEVSIEGYTWDWIAPVMRKRGSAVTITARASDRMESMPGGVLPPAR
jgi:Flp pilus assembly protein TadG